MTHPYVALLRGINVGGHRLIKMQALKEIFTTSGFANVSTYIQSGNVLFHSTETDSVELTRTIESQLHKSLGYAVTVLLRTPAELSDVLEQHPFGHVRVDTSQQIYITFMSAIPDQDRQMAFMNYQTEWETFHFRNRELYSLVRKDSPQKANFSNTFVEKKLSVLATTRNQATVQKLDLLLQAL